jgi:signal transduction histidine kinase
VVCTVLSIIANVAGGPATWALVSLAARRQWREIFLLGLITLVSGAAYVMLYPGYQPADPLWVEYLVLLLFVVLLLVLGMYVGSRRELIWTLRQRAERAEAAQEARASQAQAAERTRIAREMHDVLAHRISQISMHAGALSYREDLDAAALRAGAAEIRDRSHEALEDLRSVLGVLRTTDPERTDREAPQPTYRDLAALIQDSRDLGQVIIFEDHLERDVAVPEVVGRALYRIVQEGLTNAAKHAPGVAVTVRISGTPADGVSFQVRSRLLLGHDVPQESGRQPPGAGLGLVGLAERAELAGGRLRAGRSGGRFVVEGWLPWAP